MKFVCLLITCLCLIGCGDRKTAKESTIRVIHLNPGDPAPIKTSCWFDQQIQCHGCYYYFSSGDEAFICDGAPIGPGPIYPPYGG